MSSPGSQHYRGAEGHQYHHGKRKLPDEAFPWVARLRAEKLGPHINADDSVFEYGVGSGWNLALLNCKRRVGFDVADFLEPVIRARGIEFVADAAHVPSGSMDVVICHHTLEHVIHPAVVLQGIQRILRPGGKLLLYVPYERERRYQTFNPAEPNHHLYSWNVQTLGNLVQETGFLLHSAGVGPFGYDRFAAVWALRLRAGEGGFRLLRRMLLLLKPAQEVRIIARPSTSVQKPEEP